MPRTYIVSTRDVDGSGTRRYKTAVKACARFREMAGHSVLSAHVAAYDGAPDGATSESIVSCPTFQRIRTVSDYGTVVTLFVRGEPTRAGEDC